MAIGPTGSNRKDPSGSDLIGATGSDLIGATGSTGSTDKPEEQTSPTSDLTPKKRERSGSFLNRIRKLLKRATSKKPKYTDEHSQYKTSREKTPVRRRSLPPIPADDKSFSSTNSNTSELATSSTSISDELTAFRNSRSIKFTDYIRRNTSDPPYMNVPKVYIPMGGHAESAYITMAHTRATSCPPTTLRTSSDRQIDVKVTTNESEHITTPDADHAYDNLATPPPGAVEEQPYDNLPSKWGNE